jgi:hypothetical protein
MTILARPLCWLAVTASLMLSIGTASATPRSARVAARIAERAYARQSIAEARAAWAQARVEAIAPVVPVPPPPRPATVRRMLRAGVPVGAPIVAAPVLPGATRVAVATAAPAAANAVAPTPEPLPATSAAPRDGSATPAVPQTASAADVAPDGTRSVLATSEQPTPAAESRPPSGPAVSHPPIELLPVPQPE